MEELEELLQIQAKGIEKCQERALASTERLAAQNEVLDKMREEIATNHSKMEAHVNEWFENLEGEHRRLQKAILEQSGKHGETMTEMTAFKRFMQRQHEKI